MPRIARVVVPGYPHHITQRGNYKQDIFSDKSDRKKYLFFIKHESKQYGLNILAYCLMSNHVHFIGIPEKENSLGNTFKYAHMKYSQYYNKKKSLVGHLFQGRFYSCIMDELYALACARYIERNPVRAKLAKKPYFYEFSSAKVHCGMERFDDLGVNMLFEYIDEEQKNWINFIEEEDRGDQIKEIRKKTRSGRPIGSIGFIEKMEKKLGKSLRMKPKGRPRK
ncbi:MAG: transposase [Candidatus Omnitrophota bacterium]